MGRGVGAGVGIDKEPSPRRAAIEKAQAELSQEVAVREERRRELEFLEKGGNPLDFKFGDISAVGLQLLSSTDPLAERNFTSEAKGGFGLISWPNGDSGESGGRLGSILGRGSNTGSSLLPFAGDTEAVESEGNITQAGQTSQLDGNQIDSHRKESEDSGGVRLGMKNQAYARRNRPRSNRFNGHSSLRDADKGGTVPTCMKGLVHVKEAEVEILADKNCNISLITIAKAISLNKAGMSKVSSCKEHLGNDSDALQKQDAFGDLGKIAIEENHPVIKASGICEQFPRHGISVEVGFDPAVIATDSVKKVAAEDVENQDLSLLNKSVAGNKSAGNVEKEKEQSLNDGHSDSRNKGEKSLGIELEGSHRSSHTTINAIGMISASEANLEHAQEIYSIDESAEIVRTSISDQTLKNMNLETKKENIGVNNIGLHARGGATPLLEDKCLGTSNVKVNIEQASSESGVINESQGEMISSVRDVKIKDLSPQSQEGKIDNQSWGITSFQNGVRHSLARVSSSSGGSNSKCPSGVLPLEKEKDPRIIVEAERHKANLSEAAKKAHEDIILEEAEVIKAALKRSTELVRRKSFLEPPRRKSHWDFVLEEMAWMANDFMQERLWKMTAAAQVCRWAAQGKGQTDFQVNELHWKPKKVAHDLATAVLKYWQSVELLMHRDKHMASLQPDSNPSSRSLQNPNNGGAVPMEIDQSDTIKLCKKELEAGNMVSKRAVSVHGYAIRFITDTKGFGGLIQTDASYTPERTLNAGILEPLWENKFAEESLFYSVPHGAMEAYRKSVESYSASLEIREHTAVWGEIDGQVGSEGSDEALRPSEYGLTGFVDDTHVEFSPQERGFCGDDDEMRIQYLPAAFEGSNKAAIFGRKKRKNITKAPMPKTFDGRAPPGTCHWFSVGNNAENDSVISSPLINGKRSFSSSNLNVGVIPTKRIRSSSVAARRAAGTPNAGTAIASRPANKVDVSSGDTSSQQEAFNTLVAVSQPRKSTEVDSAGMCGNHLIFDGADTSFKFKKKKKSKPFGAVISSINKHTGGNTGPSGKGSESEHLWQQNVISQREQREQTKRKLDSNSLICDTSLGALGAASELQLSSSHGFVGQHAVKKPRFSMNMSDISPEVTTNVTNSIPSPGGSQMSNISNANKLIRQIASRDRGRKNKPAILYQIGPGIPWSTIEDQVLLALVHDVGSNWELVSDIINASLQIKGIFRKPKDCKERHKRLVERTVGDGGDSPEDSGSSQPYPSTLPVILKGSARMLLQRLQGPMEEDTLKTHLERIVQIGQQHCSRKIQNDSQEQKQRSQVHASHAIAISQIYSNHSSGQCLTPLDLCDEAPSNTEMLPHAHQLHASHASGLEMLNMLGTASAMQPSSAGITLLQGTRNNVQLGTCLPTSTLGLNAAGAARDVQRFPSVRPTSACVDEQQQCMQQYNRMVAGRSMQPPGISVSSGLPPTGLSSSNDCGVPMLTSGNGAGMMCGLSRGMSLPRSGFPGIGSPGISGMVSSGISSMPPSSGVAIPMSGTTASGTIHVPGNLICRPRDVQMLRPGQEQRQMLMQEIQLQTSQGNGQAATSFNSVNNVFSNQMVSSPTQGFSGQQQHHQKQQQQQGPSNQHYSQSQNPNHNQAYMQAVRQLQQQQQNRYLQPQQQFSVNGSLLSSLPQSQPHPLSHSQHTMPSQPHVLSQDHQQQPPLSQHALQQQATAQQQSTSQSAPILQQSQLQQCGASPLNSPVLQNLPQQQQPSLTQPSGQNPQAAVQSKSQQQNQIQKQQQQAKVSRGLGREVSMLQNPSAQPAQPNGLGSVSGNSLPTQLQAQQVVHSVPAQRTFPAAGLLHLGKQMSQSVTMGKQSQLQGHVARHDSVNLSQISTTLCQQQKGFSQQSSSKQQTYQLASQQQIPSASATNHQVLAPSPPSTQQLHLPVPEQQTSSVPPPLASSSQQQQRSTHPQQTVQRRLLQRQISSNVGLQSSPQHGKDCMQQQSQAISQAGHGTFHGSNAVNPLNMASTSSVVPLSSALNSSTTAVHSAPWKGGQNIPQITGGLYNLSRSNSGASTAQTSPASSSPGMSVTLSNGNAAISTTTTTSLLAHGVNMAGLSQQQSGGPIGLVQEHKVGTISAVGARAVQQMVAKRSPQQPQLQHQQQHTHNEMQSSIASSLGISYLRPPTSGSLTSTTGAGVSIRSQYQTSSMSMAGHSVSSSMPMYGSAQLRQAYVGNSHGQGATSHISIGSSSPSLISADIPGASAGLDSVLAITSIATVTMPSTSTQQ